MSFEFFKNLVKKNLGIILAAVVILLLVGGYLAVSRLIVVKNSQVTQEEDLRFDPEGPYAILIPRRDGNALVLNLKRTAFFDAISYELAYNAEGIDRGVMGGVDTGKKKGEYEQEILFGTCSKNICKYDRGVANGTLVLKINKGNRSYKMITQWHLQKPQEASGVLTSGDNHFSYKVGASEELTATGFTIVNDLSGTPKLPNGKKILGKVYTLNVPLAKTLRPGIVTIELVENPPTETAIARYAESKNEWEMLNTTVEGSKLLAATSGSGIFAVLVDSK